MAEACRRCSECVGAEHHWLDHVTYPGQDDGEGSTYETEFVGFICKHCETVAVLCDECDGPIYPITGASVCADCTAERGDFEP
jgi:hypothetical protein